MKRLFKFNIFMFFLIMITAYLGAELVKASDTVTVSYEATHHQSEAREMLRLLNEFRTGGTWYWNQDNTTKTNIAPNELQPLQWDYELEKLAIKRAEEIAIFFSHTRPAGNERELLTGENIAAGQENFNSAFIAWREDEDPYLWQGHRRNMLNNRYTHVGIACVERDGRKYWVQNFSFIGYGNTPIELNNSTEQVRVNIKKDFIKEVGIELKTVDSYVGMPLPKNEDSDYLVIDAGESIKLQEPMLYYLIEDEKVYVSDVKITSRSEDESIARVGSDGTITGISKGKTRIIYEGLFFNGLFSDYAEITVELTDISGFSLYFDDEEFSYSYTGNPIKPKAIADNPELVEGRDYILEYKNNIEVGKAVVVAKGINKYEGKLEKKFEIVPADGEKFAISGIADKNYTGKKIYQNISIVNDEGKKLIENVDYTLKYSDNIEPGEATIDIEYKGNYQGNVSKYFNIIEKDKEIKKKPAKFNDENNLKTSQSRKDNVKIKNVKPKINKIRIDKGKISVFIKFKKGISYKLQYSDNKKMVKPMTIKVKGNKTTIENLISGKTYYIRIGILSNGKMNWSVVKKIKIK